MGNDVCSWVTALRVPRRPLPRKSRRTEISATSVTSVRCGAVRYGTVDCDRIRVSRLGEKAAKVQANSAHATTACDRPRAGSQYVCPVLALAPPPDELPPILRAAR